MVVIVCKSRVEPNIQPPLLRRDNTINHLGKRKDTTSVLNLLSLPVENYPISISKENGQVQVRSGKRGHKTRVFQLTYLMQSSKKTLDFDQPKVVNSWDLSLTTLSSHSNPEGRMFWSVRPTQGTVSSGAKNFPD